MGGKPAQAYLLHRIAAVIALKPNHGQLLVWTLLIVIFIDRLNIALSCELGLFSPKLDSCRR